MKRLQLNIKIDMLDQTEKKLITEVSKTHFYHKKGEIILLPLQRVGTRKSKIFITYFKKIGGTPSRVFLLKIGDKKYIEREYRRWNYYLKDHINTNIYEKRSKSGLGIILYDHAGAFTAEEITKSREMNDILFSGALSLKRKLKVLDKLYDEEMFNLNKGAKVKDCESILKEYEWYLRLDRGSKLLKSWLGANKEEDSISFLGYNIWNPLKFLQEFGGFKQETKIKVKNLHGDLHPRNIILNKDLIPRLIDFEWAHRGHCLKDYVLLECSIKFFQLDKTLPLNHLVEFEQKLIDFERIEESHKLFTENQGFILWEAYKLIRHLREKAINFCIWKNIELEYLCALFFVSYGLLNLTECNTIYCLISIGLIIEKLKSCQATDLTPVVIKT